MAFKVFTLLINGLVPVIPAWFIMNSHPETAVIKPWPIVWTLLGINVLLMLIAWKHLGYTRRQRETEALMLIVNAFVSLWQRTTGCFLPKRSFRFPCKFCCTVSCRLYGLSRLKLHRIGSDASDNAKPRSEPCRANSTLNPERRF